MEFLKRFTPKINHLTEIGISIIVSWASVLEVLFKGASDSILTKCICSR